VHFTDGEGETAHFHSTGQHLQDRQLWHVMAIENPQLWANEFRDNGGERLRRHIGCSSVGGLEGNPGEGHNMGMLPCRTSGRGESQLSKPGDRGLVQRLGPSLPLRGDVPLERRKVRAVEICRRFNHGADLPS
jgi:hypothetical protein